MPAFYRVELRRLLPGMPRTGAAQYPRRALPQFFIDYGGYLVDSVLYRSAITVGPKTLVDLEQPVMTRAEWLEAQVREALEGEARVTSPNGATESAVAISPVNPNLVIAGSNGPGSGQNIHDYFEFGDYSGLGAQLDRLVAIFTDNRNETGGTGDSIDVYAAGELVGTPPLFADDFESGDTSAWSAELP